MLSGEALNRVFIRIIMGCLTMIHRIFFDVGYEDFDTSTDLLIKFPKAQMKPLEEENDNKTVELENGRFLFKYS